MKTYLFAVKGLARLVRTDSETIKSSLGLVTYCDGGFSAEPIATKHFTEVELPLENEITLAPIIYKIVPINAHSIKLVVDEE